MSLYDSASLYDNGTTFDGYPAGLATQPVVGVFIAFNDGAYVAEPDWLEVTQYVRNINVRRGRGDDLQNFPSGSASVTLDNRLRLFDPFNTASIYNGKLKPRRQIKIVGQWAGVNYPMFRGYIAGWPVGESDAGKDSTVQLDCFDALGLLAAEKTAFDPLYVYTRSLSPVDYWRCADNASSDELVNEIRNNNLRSDYSAGNAKFSSVSPMQSTLRSNAATIDVNETQLRNTPATGTLRPESYSLSVWAKTTAPNNSFATMFRNDIFMQLVITTTTASFSIVYGTQASATRYQTTTTSGKFNCAEPHYFVGTWDKDTSSLKLYIDGIDVTQTVVVTASNKSEIDRFTLNEGTFQECAIYNYTLSASQTLALYQFGAEQILETTTARATRILLDSSFPSTLVSLPATPFENVSEVVSGSTTLNELQEVSDSEGGEIFVSASGVVTVVDRDYFADLPRSNTSQMTFTDTGTGVGYDADSLGLAFDADHVRNSVEIKFSNGASVISRDAVSVADNGEAGESVDTIIATGVNAKVLADRLVTIYKNPKLRVDPFSVNGGRDPSYAWPLLLSLELLDRFTFKRTPSVGSAIQQDMLLQSVEHQITPGSWVTTVNGSARYTGWFTVGVSLIGGTDVLL